MHSLINKPQSSSKPGPRVKPAPTATDDEFLARAAALHLEGKAEEAFAELERALDTSTQPAKIHAAMGYVLYEMGQHAKAAASYQKLLSCEPSHPTGPFNLALCLEALGQWKEATD